MRIIESYSEETQRILRQICGELKKIENLECYKTNRVIDDADSVYYENNALVREEARTIIDALYLGPLSELREWCREQGFDDEIELTSGPITLDLPPSDDVHMEEYLEEEEAVEEEE